MTDLQPTEDDQPRECSDDPKLTDEELEAIDVLSKLSPEELAAVEQLAAAEHDAGGVA